MGSLLHFYIKEIRNLSDFIQRLFFFTTHLNGFIKVGFPAANTTDRDSPARGRKPISRPWAETVFARPLSKIMCEDVGVRTFAVFLPPHPAQWKILRKHNKILKSITRQL
jgi:hypothetical protein